MKYNVPFIKPSFPAAALIAEDYEKILEANWFTNFGQFEHELRDEAALFLGGGVEVCSVANATLGIEIAIKALLGQGDGTTEVLIPSFTFAAGPEMLITNGFRPVYIDVDENMQPDLAQAKRYITENSAKVVGILLCNVFGVGNPRIDDWEVFAKKRSIPLLIDSAAGFGSQYNASEMVGARGDCEIFSLHATKPFAVGEGGFVVSRNKDLIVRLRQIENFGFNESRSIGFIGTNAKLQELSCAVGVRQLKGFRERLENRRKSLSVYKRLLEPHGFTFQTNDELSTVPFVTTLAKTTDDARAILAALLAASIEARNYYHPLHKEQELMKYATVAESLQHTDDVSSRILSLPLHDGMAESVIESIVSVIMTAVRKDV